MTNTTKTPEELSTEAREAIHRAFMAWSEDKRYGATRSTWLNNLSQASSLLLGALLAHDVGGEFDGAPLENCKR